MKFILAGTLKEFVCYCREHKIPLEEVRYLSNESVIFGYKDPEIILYGTYWRNPVYGNPWIYSLLKDIDDIHDGI